MPKRKHAPHQALWFRAVGPLPDETALHQCVVAYASDMTLLDTSLLPHGLTLYTGTLQTASLDHAMWFHRPFRADEWLLYVQESPSASGARGFNRGCDLSPRRRARRIGRAGRPDPRAPRREEELGLTPPRSFAKIGRRRNPIGDAVQAIDRLDQRDGQRRGGFAGDGLAVARKPFERFEVALEAAASTASASASDAKLAGLDAQRPPACEPAAA